MPVAQAVALSIGYRRHEVYTNVDFEVPNGMVALLGPNGAGKTTLLNALATLRQPLSGRLLVLGEDVSTKNGRLKIRRRSSYLAQNTSYHPGFTVLEHVQYSGWLKGLNSRELGHAVPKAIADVHMSDQSHRKMRALSGGQRQRAAIAGALVNSPDLLLMDEPTSGLDPAQRASFRRMIRSLAGSSCSVIMSTHLVEDAAAICDSVVVVDQGHVVFSGHMTGLVSRSANDLESAYLSLVAEDISPQ